MPRRGTGRNNERPCGVALGKRIKSARLEKKMTIQKLADGVGVQSSFINQLESGDRVPSFGTLIKLINTLDISADELLYDYINYKQPDILVNRISRMLQDATESQIKHIEAHILLELSIDDD